MNFKIKAIYFNVLRITTINVVLYSLSAIQVQKRIEVINKKITEKERNVQKISAGLQLEFIGKPPKSVGKI